MKKYIGFKMIEAEGAYRHLEDMGTLGVETYYLLFKDIKSGFCLDTKYWISGYQVTYPDGYISWSPKEVFEKAYMEVGENNTIVETNVNDFVKEIEYEQWGEKTTIAHATLANGFTITESSSCVDPENFNMDIGSSICREKIYSQVWNHLGFLLQSAKYGIK